MLAFLVLLLCGAVGLVWFEWSYVTGLVRERLEREMSQALHSPSRIGALHVSLIPLHVRAARITLGTTQPVADIGALDVRLWALASLSEWRLVLSIRLETPSLDLTGLPAAEPTSKGGKRGPLLLPPLRLKKIEITQARLQFPMGDTIAHLDVADVHGSGETRVLQRRVLAQIEGQGVQLQRKSYRLRLSDIRAAGAVDANGVSLSSATVKGDGIAVAVRSTGKARESKIVATFDPGLLGVVVDELALLGGEAQVTGTLRGDLANPIGDGHLAIRNGTIAQRAVGDLDAHVTHAGARLGFDNLHLVGPAGSVSGAVDLTIDKEVPINAELDWQQLDIATLLSTVDAPLPLRDAFRGSTSLHGALDPLDLHIRGTGTLNVANGDARKEVANLEVGARIEPHALDAQLALTQPEGNQVSAHVALEGEQFRGGINLKAQDLRALNAVLPEPVPALALAGQGDGTAEFAGTVEHPVVSGTISLDNMTVVGAAVSRLKGDFSIAAGRLVTKGTRIDAASGSATLTGALALTPRTENDWQLTLHAFDANVLTALASGFSGRELPIDGGILDGVFSCHDTWPRAQTDASLAVESLHIADEPLERVSLKATTQLPEWQLHLQAIHGAQERVTIDGAGEGQSRLRLNLDSTAIDLANFRGAGRARVTGTVRVHGQASGSLLQPDGSFEIVASSLGVRGRAVGDVALRATGANGQWTIAANAFKKTLNIDATVRTSQPFPYTLTAHWQNSGFSEDLSADESVHVRTSGVIDLAGSLQDPAMPSGSIRVTNFELNRDEYRVTTPEPIRIEVDRGHFTVRSFVLASGESRLTVTGEVTTGGEVSLNARGQGDLVLLELIGRPFEAARGQFLLAARIRRRPESGWDLSGNASVRDAVLDLGLPVVFQKVDGALSLAGSTIHVDNLTGKAGGGEFSVGGSVDVTAGPRLSWTVHDVALSVASGLEARLSGNGKVQGRWREMTVGGTVEVLNALYDRDIELQDFLPWFQQQVLPAPRAQSPNREVHFDLVIYSRGGVYVDNNVANVEMWLNLQLEGTVAKPVLTGTIGFLNGEVGFRGRTFTITSGTIDFRDRYRMNPILNITAESRISTPDSDYTVTAAVSGTADNPRVQFSADDPNLSQNDVLSLVASGKTTAQLQREGGGVSAVDALALLPTGSLEKQVGKFVGVERFEVEATQSRNTGAIEPRVTIGKDLTEKLRASISTSFGVEAQRNVQLEYRLTRKISLLGSWEGQTESQAGAFGGDVKFRYDFRRLPFSLLGGKAATDPTDDAR